MDLFTHDPAPTLAREAFSANAGAMSCMSRPTGTTMRCQAFRHPQLSACRLRAHVLRGHPVLSSAGCRCRAARCARLRAGKQPAHPWIKTSLTTLACARHSGPRARTWAANFPGPNRLTACLLCAVRSAMRARRRTPSSFPGTRSPSAIPPLSATSRGGPPRCSPALRRRRPR